MARAPIEQPQLPGGLPGASRAGGATDEVIRTRALTKVYAGTVLVGARAMFLALRLRRFNSGVLSWCEAVCGPSRTPSPVAGSSRRCARSSP